jgi:hypothetical protein
VFRNLSYNDQGYAHILLVVAAIGVVFFILVVGIAPFKDNFLSAIYNKTSTFAAGGPDVLNFAQVTPTPLKNKKVDFSFDLSSVYPNPYYYYDASDTPASNPSNTSFFGQDGITVDMNLTSPSGKTIKVPAFWMEDYTRLQNSGFEILGKKDNGKWWVRFTPTEVGNYQFFITTQDKNGTARFPLSGTQSFVVGDSNAKGFIHTSLTDPRFLQYDTGEAFIPIPSGHQWWKNSSLRSYEYESLFNSYGQNGINLIRIWSIADFALAIEDASPVWIRQGFSNPGGALGTEINTTNVHSGIRAAKPVVGQGWYQRIAFTALNQPHKLTAWIKTDAVSGGNVQINIKNGTTFNVGTTVAQLPTVSGTTGWTQYSTTFTPTTSVASINLFLSGGTGAVYIDDIVVGPTDQNGNITYNVVSDPGMERHFAKDLAGNDPNVDPALPRPIGNFFNQWMAYDLDKIVESAESNGVAIQLCACSGPWFTWQQNPDNTNYADAWALKNWQRNYRYQIARWGYSPAILAWEKHNEHGHIPIGSALYNFYQNLGNYQKTTDPYQHLRTTSQGSQTFSPGLWSSGGFDMANYHDYMMSFRPAALYNDEVNFISKYSWCLADSMKRSNSPYCSGLGLGDGSTWQGVLKPWIWGELDVGTDQWNVANPATANGANRINLLHNFVWAGLFNPLGTVGIDWYWDNEDASTITAKYAAKKAAANFFSDVKYATDNFIYLATGADAPPGYTGETIQSSDAKARVYAMKSGDKKRAYLWVQHRDNIWSLYPAVPTSITPTITVSNLLNENYSIQIWNTMTGTIISTNQQTPTNGVLAISLPAMTTDVAIKLISTVGPSPSIIPSPSVVASASPVISPSPVPSVKLGDIDGNGKVDIFDYNILLTNFGQSGTGIQGDINNSGKVDIFDYNILLTNFGK